MKKIIILIYQLLVWLPLSVTATVITAITVSVGCLLGGERFFSYYPGVWWSRFICFISLCPVKVKGREKLKKQSYIFVANHQGAYDIFLIYGFLNYPIKWVMKQSLRKIPFVGKACELAGFIFVDSSSPQAAAKTVKEAEEKLKNGGASIVIFPEGSRTFTGEIGKFKKGAYQMAMDLKLPIVPITINGSFDVMKRGSFLLNPHKMELVMHDPILTDNLNVNNVRDVANNIRNLADLSRNEIDAGLWSKYKSKNN
ncbi:1-acyl-sn-glycerol-3-phosphate acyltransferase [Dysgonomonadaceae bacterium PH5-43]|nr:1-acyl-sn-glycerol-3-phosphate acyltransferase [Dysgonomonadaceae bacterium PH5-43]